MNDNWYEAVDGDVRLTQGDIILDCPLLRWKDVSSPLTKEDPDTLKRALDVIRADVVVMTQACDLENEKVKDIVLCPHVSITKHQETWETEMRKRTEKSLSKFWQRYCDDICKGVIFNLSILNSGDTGTLTTDHRIVDFSEIFTIPRSFLESLLKERNQPRLRLLPPYREHLSQAFARFFMRVGLPTDISKVW